MSKAFREAFPTLKLEEELEGLLDTTEVTKISANHEHCLLYTSPSPRDRG